MRLLGTTYRTGTEALVYVSIQIAGVACVFLAYSVPGTAGMAVAVAGCSATLGVAMPRREGWKARYTQVGASVTALIVAAMLLVEGPSAGSTKLTPATAQPEFNEPSAEVEQEDHSASPTRSAPPTIEPSAADERVKNQDTDMFPTYVPPQSTGSGELELAEEIGGVKLPDLGDGNPFATVNMTKAEMQAFEQLYVDLVTAQKELQASYQEGEIGYDDFAEKLEEHTAHAMAELEALMGAQRLEILTQELARYYQKLALNLDQLDDETVAAMKRSPIFSQAFQPPPTPQTK
jgi:hypothetical protein